MTPTSKRSSPHLSSQELAALAAKGAENKKADDIEIINVNKHSSVCDCIVICTASSGPQLGGIADGVEEILDKNGIKNYRRHGTLESNWLIVDLFNVVVHIMHRDERFKYNLEELWGSSGMIYHV